MVGSIENLSGRRVLITGHTGFKGAWLSAWLSRRGAEVTGYSLEPEGDPNLWTLLAPALPDVKSVLADLNDRAALDRTISEADPEIVFHMAAQTLVRRSYREPVETFATNVLGTVQLLDAMRAAPSVRAIVVVTSDKAYENTERPDAYRETDPVGGHDPYSASKGATELAVTAMRRSYFSDLASDGGHPARIATARAGNVIGGGDWSEDRLIPDIVRGCLGPDGKVHLRRPGAIRPWQHVLEPLLGYCDLAAALLAGQPVDEAWNFGPAPDEEYPVELVARAMIEEFGQGEIVIDPGSSTLHEASLLRVDATKARERLGWRPMLSFEETVAMTAEWYSAWNSGGEAVALCQRQIADYEARVAAARTGDLRSA